ncbi:MAG: hypothetical protein R3F59_37625 [Myxococcota bacterium]
MLLLSMLFAPALAADLTVADVVSAGLDAKDPVSMKGSETCECMVVDYGDKGTLKLTGAEVAAVTRVTGSSPVLTVTVGSNKLQLASGLCEKVALLSLSASQWLKKDLAVVDSAGKPSSPGCNVIPH